ncbi:MAG: dTDP-glucose 4,6-dehydratase, partial [uncultured Sphingomonas sp.]
CDGFWLLAAQASSAAPWFGGWWSRDALLLRSTSSPILATEAACAKSMALPITCSSRGISLTASWSGTCSISTGLKGSCTWLPKAMSTVRSTDPRSSWKLTWSARSACWRQRWLIGEHWMMRPGTNSAFTMSQPTRSSAICRSSRLRCSPKPRRTRRPHPTRRRRPR